MDPSPAASASSPSASPSASPSTPGALAHLVRQARLAIERRAHSDEICAKLNLLANFLRHSAQGITKAKMTCVSEVLEHYYKGLIQHVAVGELPAEEQQTHLMCLAILKLMAPEQRRAFNAILNLMTPEQPMAFNQSLHAPFSVEQLKIALPQPLPAEREASAKKPPAKPVIKLRIPVRPRVEFSHEDLMSEIDSFLQHRDQLGSALLQTLEDKRVVTWVSRMQYRALMLNKVPKEGAIEQFHQNLLPYIQTLQENNGSLPERPEKFILLFES